jgi:hypothetical protein
MKKDTNPWQDSDPATPQKTATDRIKSAAAPQAGAADADRPTTAQQKRLEEPLYDIEGLMTDFPTARELEKFVFDQTGIVLNLKGRSNKFKYQTAMDVLNGQTPDEHLLGKENPYLDKNDLIPVDELRRDFPPCMAVWGQPMVSFFQSRQFPHPDPDWKASGQKCDVIFKKYANDVVTYEIIGPVAARAVGTRVNKFGKEVPEKYEWVDPRTGEQVLRDETGRLTPIGTRLKSALSRAKINKSDYWTVWIDREFTIGGDAGTRLDSPWEI